MSWTKVTPAAETWVGVSPATETWSTGAASTGLQWAQMSSVTTTVDDGVDFRLKMRTDYPMRIRATRPLVMVTQFAEGRP